MVYGQPCNEFKMYITRVLYYTVGGEIFVFKNFHVLIICVQKFPAPELLDEN